MDAIWCDVDYLQFKYTVFRTSSEHLLNLHLLRLPHLNTLEHLWPLIECKVWKTFSSFTGVKIWTRIKAFESCRDHYLKSKPLIFRGFLFFFRTISEQVKIWGCFDAFFRFSERMALREFDKLILNEKRPIINDWPFFCSISWGGRNRDFEDSQNTTTNYLFIAVF